MSEIGDSNTPTNNEEDRERNLSLNEETNQSTRSSMISDLKKQHFKEITELRNQLDEITTRATILEATKQDELDEIRSRSTQEIDSLNHIINTLQNDLSQIRNEYENLNNSYREIKKQNHNLAAIMQQQQQQQQQLIVNNNNNNLNEIKSPTQANPPVSQSRLTLSPFGHHNHHHHHHHDKHYNHNISQENENLEEDMRKAKESADMLRSVVLPLETEISTLRTRSNTADERIKELEKLVEQNERDKNKMLEQEKKLVEEILNNDNSEESTLNEPTSLIKKYLLMKNYLKKSELNFIDLEKQNLKSIKQIYSLLNREQKLKLIPNRPKSRSFIKQNNELNVKNEEVNENQQDLDIEKNEIISKIEELLNYLTLNEQSIDDDKTNLLVINSIDSNNSTTTNTSNHSDINKSLLAHSYAELLAMYEREKELRIDIETNFHHKAKESNRQIENLNKEMSNLASIIEDLRKQYSNLQNQYQFQIDSLIKLNEEIRNDMNIIEGKNEKYKTDNLRLKAENKQFYGEQTILSKEVDQTYPRPNNMEEAVRQLETMRTEIVKLVIANQALNKQCNLSTESIRHLKDLNLKYQRSNNLQDQIVITQSLESELERERKVRLEAEQEKNDAKNQLKVIKERGQTIVEQLKQRNDLNELEIKKIKDENQELLNQIASLKKDSKNNLSVQEDLVKLIQSLQIELNQFKTTDSDGLNKTSMIEVRCQHEDDFNDCASCKSIFSVTKRKHRCKHCCKIFCADCCAKTVYSGPNLRPHKVCDSCHTLLDKDSSRQPIPSNI